MGTLMLDTSQQILGLCVIKSYKTQAQT